MAEGGGEVAAAEGAAGYARGAAEDGAPQGQEAPRSERKVSAEAGLAPYGAGAGGGEAELRASSSGAAPLLAAGRGEGGEPPAARASPALTDEEVQMLAEMKAVNEQANRLIADHLEAYLRRNGAEATYEGWIGVLHPENCTLDERLLLPESEHLRLWRERGGARASEGERDGFWKAVATLAKNVTGERGGGRGRSGGGGGGAARGGRGGEPGGGAAPRPLVWSPLVEMGGEARDAPLDAADVATLEEAREEIKRLRGLLAQASDARAGKAAAPRAHAEEPPKTRLDALLSLTRFHSAAEAEAVQQHSEAKPPRASISKPLNVPSVDECFGHLFAPIQPPATTGSSAGSLRPGPPGGNPFDAVVAQPASPPKPAAPRAPVSASSTPLNPFGESSPAVSKPNPRSGSAHNPFD